MMGAVDQARILIEPVHKAAVCGFDFMDLIPVCVLVGMLDGQILYQVSAEIDVDDLHAPADAKYRFSCLHEGV